MFEALRRFGYSFVRWGQSHGFGVQSPTAYKFIKDIVRGKNLYYDCQNLSEKHCGEDLHHLAFHSFLLRFSNFMQDRPWAINSLDDIDKDCISSGSSKASVSVMPLLQSDNFLRQLDIFSAVVIKDIHFDVASWELWTTIVKSKPDSASFDLYDCGVIFLDHSMQKGSYKVTLKA